MASDDQVPVADRSSGQERRLGQQSAAEVRARRERLRAELINLEQVLSGPAADAEGWVAQVRTAAVAMAETLREHVEETEGPDGMLAQVATDAPWLEGRLLQLREEHGQLVADADALIARCDRPGVTAQQLRDEALHLLQQVSRHRQQGTDLLYDAYLVDISAAD